MQLFPVSSRTGVRKFQNVLGPGSGTYSGAQHLHELDLSEPLTGVASIRTRGRCRNWPESNSEILIYVIGSTASSTQWSLPAVAEAMTLTDFSCSQHDEDRELVERGFSHLAAFTIEPEQPSNADIVRHSVYHFPSR